MKLRLTIAYDGTNLRGWQSQPGGGTVQDHLERAFHEILGETVSVHGAGRTDAGVHALGQCAHVEVPERLPDLESWRRALNARLPNEIRVMQVRRAAEEFHARFSARGKLYRYTLWTGPVLPPWHYQRAWHLPGEFDEKGLGAACALFPGKHDFAAFSARRSKEPVDTVRTLSSVQVMHRGPLIQISYLGEGFLYKMVRMLTAAAVRHASGKAELDELASRLQAGSPRWNHVAPAGGLCLVKVLY